MRRSLATPSPPMMSQMSKGSRSKRRRKRRQCTKMMVRWCRLCLRLRRLRCRTTTRTRKMTRSGRPRLRSRTTALRTTLSPRRALQRRWSLRRRLRRRDRRCARSARARRRAAAGRRRRALLLRWRLRSGCATRMRKRNRDTCRRRRDRSRPARHNASRLSHPRRSRRRLRHATRPLARRLPIAPRASNTLRPPRRRPLRPPCAPPPAMIRAAPPARTCCRLRRRFSRTSALFRCWAGAVVTYSPRTHTRGATAMAAWAAAMSSRTRPYRAAGRGLGNGRLIQRRRPEKKPMPTAGLTRRRSRASCARPAARRARWAKAAKEQTRRRCFHEGDGGCAREDASCRRRRRLQWPSPAWRTAARGFRRLEPAGGAHLMGCCSTRRCHPVRRLCLRRPSQEGRGSRTGQTRMTTSSGLGVLAQQKQRCQRIGNAAQQARRIMLQSGTTGLARPRRCQRLRRATAGRHRGDAARAPSRRCRRRRLHLTAVLLRRWRLCLHAPRRCCARRPGAHRPRRRRCRWMHTVLGRTRSGSDEVQPPSPHGSPRRLQRQRRTPQLLQQQQHHSHEQARRAAMEALVVRLSHRGGWLRRK